MKRRERGNILISVMVLMLLAMLLASALVEHFAVTEARDVEESLARVRSYWALSGMTDHALSRARGAGNLPETDSAKLPAINNYFDELDGDAGDDDNSYTFTYLPNHWLTVQGVAALHPDNPDDGTTDDGRLILTLTLTAAGTLDHLTTLNNRVRSLTVNLCMRPEPGDRMNNAGVDATPQETSACPDPAGTNGQSWIRGHAW